MFWWSRVGKLLCDPPPPHTHTHTLFQVILQSYNEYSIKWPVLRPGPLRLLSVLATGYDYERQYASTPTPQIISSYVKVL